MCSFYCHESKTGRKAVRQSTENIYMQYEEFIKKVKAAVEERLTEGEKITLSEVTKNNDVALTGLCIMEREGEIGPNIYLNDFYEVFKKGKSIEEIAELIVDRYKNFKVEETVDMSFFTDFSKVQDKIVYRLVNLERNKERLKEMPYFTYLDFAIIFYCHLKEEKGYYASVPIYKHHMKMWKITKAELLSLAKKNTPRLFPCDLISMQSILDEFVEADEEMMGVYGEKNRKEPVSVQMYILTNSSRLNGASVILYEDILKDFATACKGSFFLLPSSIHEVILVPADSNTSMEEFTQMVREVNETQVDEEELLSDHAYYYDSKKGLLLL